MSVPSESFCGVGRPCPNFQRLIEFGLPVFDRKKGAAGDGLQSGEDRSSNAIMRWNPQNVSRAQSSCSLNRKPKFMDIRLSSPLTGRTKKLEGPPEVSAKNKAQQGKWGPRQFQTKPKETTKKPENPAGVPVKNVTQQRKWEPKLGAAKPGVKANEMTKKQEIPAKDQRKWEPKLLRAKSNVTNPTSPLLDAKLDEELSRMLTQYGASKLDRRLRQLVELEERKKTPRKQWQ